MASYNFTGITNSAEFRKINRMLYLYRKVKAENITFTETQIANEIKTLVRAHSGYGLSESEIDNLVIKAKGMTGTTRVPTDLSDLNAQFQNYARGEINTADHNFDVADAALKDSNKIIQDGNDAQAELDFDGEQRKGKYIKNTLFGVAIGVLVSAVLPAAGIPLLMSQLGVAAIGGGVGFFYGGKKSIEKAIKEGALLSAKDRAELQKKVRAGNLERLRNSGTKASSRTAAQQTKNNTHSKFAGYESSSNELDLIAEEQRQLDIDELETIRTNIESLRTSTTYISAPNPGYADSDKIKARVEAICKEFDPADAMSYFTKITGADYNDPTKANNIKATMNEAQGKLAEVKGLIDNSSSPSKLSKAASNFTAAEKELQDKYVEYNKYFAVLPEVNVRGDGNVSAAHNEVAGIYHRLLSDVSADTEEDIRKKIETQQGKILDLKHEVAIKLLDGKTKVTGPSLSEQDKALNDAIGAKNNVQETSSPTTDSEKIALKNKKLLESIFLSVYRMYEIKQYVDGLDGKKEVKFKNSGAQKTVDLEELVNATAPNSCISKVLKLRAEAVSTTRSRRLDEIEQEITKYVSEAKRYMELRQKGEIVNEEEEPEMV